MSTSSPIELGQRTAHRPERARVSLSSCIGRLTTQSTVDHPAMASERDQCSRPPPKAIAGRHSRAGARPGSGAQTAIRKA